MLSYTFSKREKALILFLAVALLAVVWYMMIYRGTAESVADIEQRISDTQTQIETDTAQVAQLESMKQTVAEHKGKGATVKSIPDYDNVKPLMSELNRVLGAAQGYSLSFDELDRDAASEYVLRGTTMKFECASYEAAESAIDALADGPYPCVIDSVSISDGTVSSSSGSSSGVSVGRASGNAAPVSVSIHATFFEKA